MALCCVGSGRWATAKLGLETTKWREKEGPLREMEYIKQIENEELRKRKKERGLGAKGEKRKKGESPYGKCITSFECPLKKKKPYKSHAPPPILLGASDRRMAVVADHPHALKPPMRSQRCRLPSYTHLNCFMLEPPSKIDIVQSLGEAVRVASFHRSVSTPCLTLNPKAAEEDSSISSNPRIEIIGGKGSPRVRALVAEVTIAVAFGADPVPVSSGLGGAYVLRGRNGNSIAVAKPIDEEPLAFNNPKGFTGRMLGQPGLKRSIRLGETGMRELAAYLLDHGGFAGVPPTALVKISNLGFNVNVNGGGSPPDKVTSLQRFVDHDCDAGELGPSGFSVSSVHRIGILDVRLLNTDRHSGNILVKKHEQRGDDDYCSSELVPIDHGLCLPEWLDDPYFEWLHWPQAAVPFSESELDYVSKLNPVEDAKLLRNELPCLSESSIRVLVVCTVFLKRAAAAGLSLADIGEMLTRECYGGEETMSILENVCAKAKDSLISNNNNSNMLNYDDYSSSVIEEKSEEDFRVFEFEDDRYGDITDPPSPPPPPPPPPPHTTTSMKPSAQIPKLPPARSKSEFPAGTMLARLLEEEYQSDPSDTHEHDDNKSGEESKVGYLTKSFSFAVPNHNTETSGVAFGDMNEEEWDFFLEALEKLLPKVLETRKSISLMQRLGTSCKF
ncbi:hypothetical protein Dimus_002073 [Dionaea muscipula]